MKVLAIIVTIVFCLKLGFNCYVQRNKGAYTNFLTKLTNNLKEQANWEYWVEFGVAHAFDLLIIICLVAACVVL